MKNFLRAALIFSLCTTAQAAVVRPAPDFGIASARPASLRGLRGQSVVLIIARSARDRRLRDELFWLERMYQQFSTEKVVFIAAIENGPQEVRSNIPFAMAANPAQVAADYGVSRGFGIAVIGVDGNLDMITTNVIAAARVRDAIFNNYKLQQASRKQPKSWGL